MSGLSFLLEVGTEEIPAGYLAPALAALKERLAGLLIGGSEGRRIQTWGTPNRLAVAAWGLQAAEEDTVQEVTGPPVAAAYDADGNPTKAAQGFARGQGVDVSELITVETKKGPYLAARKHVQGRQCLDILTEGLPGLILGLPFPKSMRWGRGEVVFVRPIHWILAVLDGKIIPFSIGDIQSSNLSYGHRFLHPEPVEINGPDEYEDKLAGAEVIVSAERRRDLVHREIAEKVRERGQDLSIRPDKDLIDEVANLVEKPLAVCGRFDASFLELPDEALITAMREHQRYFAVTDQNGKLAPYFVAINNTRARDMNLVTRGHERVLRARLEDARFYFDEDRKRPLASRQKELERVVYHTLLGTSWEKVTRMCALSDHLADVLAPEVKALVGRAAELSKCDLITGLVMEFPSLQGVMGRIYAELDGEPPEVARAIEEHYLPVRAGGDLPQTPVGTILSLADKIETIVGCFAVGLIPTGAADPYALRRQALGVIHIILDRGYRLSLGSTIDKALEGLKPWIKRPAEEVRADVIEFFRLRLKNQLTGHFRHFDVKKHQVWLGRFCQRNGVVSGGCGHNLVVLTQHGLQHLAAYGMVFHYQDFGLGHSRLLALTA